MHIYWKPCFTNICRKNCSLFEDRTVKSKTPLYSGIRYKRVRIVCIPPEGVFSWTPTIPNFEFVQEPQSINSPEGLCQLAFLDVHLCGFAKSQTKIWALWYFVWTRRVFKPGISSLNGFYYKSDSPFSKKYHTQAEQDSKREFD